MIPPVRPLVQLRRPVTSHRLPAIFALLVSCAFILSACDDDVVGPGNGSDADDSTPGVTAVVVSPAQLELHVGTQEALSAEVQGSNGVSQSVTWESSDTQVASVNSSGQVSAVGLGTATITATSQADASASGQATVEVVCPDPIAVTGHINSDETWTGEGVGCIDYVVADMYEVRATLTIEPGTAVAFQQDAGLILEAGGAVVADGTQADPILLTGTEQVRGWWGGIDIRRSERQENLFNHVTIEYGGQDDPFNQYDPGFALKVGGPAAASGTQDTSQRFATITNTTLRGSAGYGLFIRANAQVHFAGNTLTDNALGAARMPLHVTGVLDEASDFSGNDVEIIMLTHYAAGDVELVHPGQGVRYRMGRPGNDPTRARISAQGTLTIAPGTILEFTERSDLTIPESGTLISEGTDSEPVVFTGLEGTEGFWGGITLDGSSGNSIRYTTVEYGGHFAGANVGVESGASATITDSILRYAGTNQFGSYGYGLRVTASSSVNADACEVNTFVGNAAGDCLIG